MAILSNGHQWKYSEFLDNKNYSFDKKQILNSLSKKEIDDAYSSISKWEGYCPTPLISLNKLSKELDLNKIYYKDESKRFDLKSFKDQGRFELRLMDGAANPYLLQAGIIAAGLEGINKKINPGKPLHCNMYKDYKKYPKLKKLPNDINQAISMLQKSKPLADAFGKDVIESYVKLKNSEIKDFRSKFSFNKKKPVTKWEKDNTLDC